MAEKHLNVTKTIEKTELNTYDWKNKKNNTAEALISRIEKSLNKDRYTKNGQMRKTEPVWKEETAAFVILGSETPPLSV